MLLARLLPTPAKTVRIDGNDVCDLPLSAVRKAIGYAQQDAFLFSTTVARNIGFCLDDPESDEAVKRIREASREAQVLEEALGLPEGFDTVVGERGVQLSGGQKQRIALARALVREPKVLVLDDPLSAVDAKTESAILDAVERQAESRTVVLVTHRVAAASRCDQIVVLDEGRVLEHGTHDELVAAGGLYAKFAAEQSAKSELDAVDVDDPGPAPRRAGDGGTRMSAEPTKPVEQPVERATPTQRDRSRCLRSKAHARQPERCATSTKKSASAAPTTRSSCARLWPFMRPHARFLVASLAMILIAAGLNLVRPARDGASRRERPGRSRRKGLMTLRHHALAHRRRHAGADVRADVHDADRRRALDGRSPRAPLRVHAAARAPLLRPARRSVGSSRARRTTSTRSASSSLRACSTPSAISSR